MTMETFHYIITWWSVLFLLGIGTFPLTATLFKSSVSKGYIFSKLIGILLVSYLVFVLSLLHIVRYNFTSTLFIALLLSLTSLYVLIHDKGLFPSIKASLPFILIEEFLFTIGLVFWAVIRGYQPDIIGLEKFMDLGFINTLLRTEYLPPIDMWFSGNYINYYWFGHYMTSVLTVLSKLPSVVTYNLMIATILGFSLSGAFSIVTTLLKKAKINSFKKLLIGGLLSSILLTFAGNFHTTFFSLRQKACNEGITTCSTKALQEYWYPDATRFIGYDPETEDKTIHEFPLYSFVVSDLHAHLINLPFVLLFIALLANLLLADEKDKNKFRILLGFLIGCFFMTNAWDTANYLLLTGVTLGFTELYKQKDKTTSKLIAYTIKNTMINLVVIGSTAYVTAYPFTMNFMSIAQGSAFVHAHSPLWQLLILWGIPLLLSSIFSITIYKRFKNSSLEISDLIVGCMLLTSLMLICIPEIVYVKDIYIASHHRANTMFKLTYQAFVLSYLSAGYVAVRVLQSTKSIIYKAVLLLFFGGIFSAVLQYPKLAIQSYYNDLKVYEGLRGDTWITNQYPYEKDVIDWFNTSVPGQPTILEASGDSYTDFNVISAYTGLPTVTGWFVHEWLWRGEPQYPQTRANDVTAIYTSSDLSYVSSLIKKYNISYIVIGTLERQKYPTLNESIIATLGEKAYSSGTTSVYQMPPGLNSHNLKK